MRRILNLLKSNKAEKKLITAVRTIAGFRPSNLELYKRASIHSSLVHGHRHQEGFQSNERLEHLGDAILGAVMADYLFKKFPFKDEGFLTEIRSRIVNRETLNIIGKKIGMASIIQYDQRNTALENRLLGNALEAFIGAVYLDKGFSRTKKFVVNKLILPYFNLEEVIHINANHKSKIIEWAQSQHKTVRFELIEVLQQEKGRREFCVQLFIENQPCGIGFGASKKKAEQSASEKTIQQLQLPL